MRVLAEPGRLRDARLVPQRRARVIPRVGRQSGQRFAAIGGEQRPEIDLLLAVELVQSAQGGQHGGVAVGAALLRGDVRE